MKPYLNLIRRYGIAVWLGEFLLISAFMIGLPFLLLAVGTFITFGVPQ